MSRLFNNLRSKTRFGGPLVASIAISNYAVHPRVFSASAHDTSEVFDLIVIGGGSGGIACAKRSSSYGAKVALVEGVRYGGTCVNVGCVPKKIMYNCSHVAEVIEEAHQFGFSVETPTFDWGALKSYRDRYILRLNGIYESGLESSKVTRINGMASFENENTIRVGSKVYKAKNILIATGGAPNTLGVPGDEFAIDSDGFFELPTQPKKVAVIGAGYIAVELVGVFNGLGTDTSLLVRGNCALRNFDTMVSSHLDTSMKKAGINVVSGAVIKEITKGQDGWFTVHLQDGRTVGPVEVVLKATGRHPLTEPLALPRAKIAVNAAGHVIVDEYQNTSTPGVCALGDVVGNVELTPMAIAAGRRLADRLFGGMPTAKADYSLVPTVVFSHPVIGTIGLTEKEARVRYAPEQLKVYTSSFINLWYGSYFQGGVGDKPMTRYKVICAGPEERVVGLHLIGMASDEVLQGFGVAMKMGATKADFDNCIAIHPTAAEELVTLAPWGMAPQRLPSAASSSTAKTPCTSCKGDAQ